MARIDIEVEMDVCQDHGQCVIAAPEVFWFTDDGRLGFAPVVEDADDAQIAAIEEAADICPLQAILLRRA